MRKVFWSVLFFTCHVLAGLEGVWESAAFHHNRAVPVEIASDAPDEDIRSSSSYKFGYKKTEIFLQYYTVRKNHKKDRRLKKMTEMKGYYVVTGQKSVGEKDIYEIQINYQVNKGVQITKNLKVVIEDDVMTVFESNSYFGTFKRLPDKDTGCSCVSSLLGCKFLTSLLNDIN